MPARSAFSPRRRPRRLARLCALPKSEVHRVFLMLRDIYTGACLQILKRLVGQLAVFVEFLCTEINVAVRLIRKALFDKGGNKRLDSVDVFGCSWMNGGFTDIHALYVGPKFADIMLGNLGNGNPLFVGFFNKLVVNVGKVLDKIDLIATPFKVATQHVEHAKGTRISDMNKIIYGRAASVYSDLTLFNCFKLLLASGKGVIDFHYFFPPIW